MGFFSKLGEFFASPIIGLAKDFTEARKLKKAAQAEVMVTLAKAEVEVKLARVKSKIAIAESKARMAEAQANAEHDWENIVASQMSKTWKDEYLTLFYTVIFAGLFVPGLRPHVQAGFEAANGLPEWYIWTLTAITGATFGLRAFTKLDNIRKLTKKGKDNGGQEEKE